MFSSYLFPSRSSHCIPVILHSGVSEAFPPFHTHTFLILTKWGTDSESQASFWSPSSAMAKSWTPQMPSLLWPLGQLWWPLGFTGQSLHLSSSYHSGERAGFHHQPLFLLHTPTYSVSAMFPGLLPVPQFKDASRQALSFRGLDSCSERASGRLFSLPVCTSSHKDAPG